jgi:hypothetical protein
VNAPFGPPSPPQRDDCKHEYEVRMRTIANGRRHERQCVKCGYGGGAVAKASITGPVGEWDEALVKRRDEERRRQWDEYREKQEQYQALLRGHADYENREFWRWYNQYLLTDRWREMRRLVIDRARNVCEGCGRAPIHQVHHLTYAHVGNEFLWELRGVCLSCHERIHEDRRGEHA